MQDGQPVGYASRAMTSAEINYAEIEKELLAIVFGLERFEQYVQGRPVKIETDHKPLESIFKKSLISALKRLQRMMLRLQKYDLKVTYKKGSEMYLADTLSRAFVQSSAVKDTRGDAEKDTESIIMVQYLPVSEMTQNIIRTATESDPVMKELKTTIREGWPENKDLLLARIRDYFPFREELTLQNGLVFKGERLVVPECARKEMKARIHASHIGIQGCLRRAREVLYWPGMNRDTENCIAQCNVCNSQPREQTKEPMICHEIPTGPWEKIAADLFQLNGRDYMVTVDYYSSYFEVDSLTTKTAVEVIRKLKGHLARHGIPDQVISDNGQPFASDNFHEFASTYGFEHVTSSPLYAQSNGKAENAVKKAESLLQKATNSKRDPYLSLLDWRNTPTESLNSSPAQRLFGRKTKTLLPTSNHLLKPKIPKEVEDQLTLKKAKQAMYYDRGTKELEELLPRELVRIQPQTSKLRKRKEWTLARGEGKVDIRSYQVRTEDGHVYRRNRRHLRRTRETTGDTRSEMVLPPRTKPSPLDPPDKLPVPPATPGTSESQDLPHAAPVQKPPTKPSVPSAQNKQETPPPATTTRSGRVVRPPARFGDH